MSNEPTRASRTIMLGIATIAAGAMLAALVPGDAAAAGDRHDRVTTQSATAPATTTVQTTRAMQTTRAAQATTAMQATTALQATTVKIVRCVRYWGKARYRGPGYDHVVYVHNKCTKPVRCDVSTNVNPNPIVVDVQPKESREVVTRIGSPAREFTPRVACRYIKPGTTVAH